MALNLSTTQARMASRRRSLLSNPGFSDNLSRPIRGLHCTGLYDVAATTRSLLLQLRSIKTRIGRSPISGVGVFAIRPISKNVNPFPTRQLKLRKLPTEALSRLPSSIQQLVHDYFVDENGGYMIPDDFGAVVDMESLVNHSDTPNLRYIAASGSFKTTRPILVGEELTIDYRTYTTIRV